MELIKSKGSSALFIYDSYGSGFIKSIAIQKSVQKSCLKIVFIIK